MPGVTPDSVFSIDNAAKVFQCFFCAVQGLPELLTRGRERQFFEWIFESKSMVKGAVDIDEYARSYSRPGRMSTGFEYYRAVPISLKQNAAAPVPQMPLLALGGEVSLGDNLYKAMKAKAPQTQGSAMRSVGHCVPEEAPPQSGALRHCAPLFHFRDLTMESAEDLRGGTTRSGSPTIR